eukprot:4359329-Alexandrium_andersonii.AAC.1
MPMCLAVFGIAPRLGLTFQGAPWMLPEGTAELPPALGARMQGLPRDMLNVRTLGEVFRGSFPAWQCPSFTRK